jgi:hypothetical protein
VTDFVVSALGLFDSTIKALLGVPVLAFFLVCAVVLVGVGVFRALSASGKRGR